MSVSLIAAVSENNVIGHKGRLPWHLPDDLQRFRKLTGGKTVIMGRKTYESLGQPLPNRRNIIVTRQEGYRAEGCEVVHSLEEALRKASAPSPQTPGMEEVFVIGGAELYRQALALAHRLYLTRVHAQVEGEVFFPEVDWLQWREVAREGHPADRRHPYPFTFLEYERQLL
jgi:dihydrofolate reductase